MSEHIVPKKTYLAVWAALLAFTALTVLLAYINLGPLNPVSALAIATVKAILVALFFMHVKYSTRLMKVVVVSGAFWLLILIALTLGDYLTRLWPV
jgi:cytochrome c oxidase subunit 4